MTKTDLRLAYQKETGISLTTINDFAEIDDEEDYAETMAYLRWLEETLLTQPFMY